MKRFGILMAGVLFASMAGCGGGIPEGAPTDGSQDPQPTALKDFMKQNAGNMMGPKKPSSKPKEAAPAPGPEKKDTP